MVTVLEAIENRINISALVPGFYIVRVVTELGSDLYSDFKGIKDNIAFGRD